MGTILGMIFGASSLYLVLKVGLTVSASIPVAVISLTICRLLSLAGGRGATILEHNIVQTAGSAGESIASAVVFTVPALIFLGYPLQVGLTTLIALDGRNARRVDDGVAAPLPIVRSTASCAILKARPQPRSCRPETRAARRRARSSRAWNCAGFESLQAFLGGVPVCCELVPGFKGVDRLRLRAGAARRRLHHRLPHLGDDGRREPARELVPRR